MPLRTFNSHTSCSAWHKIPQRIGGEAGAGLWDLAPAWTVEPACLPSFLLVIHSFLKGRRALTSPKTWRSWLPSEGGRGRERTAGAQLSPAPGREARAPGAGRAVGAAAARALGGADGLRDTGGQHLASLGPSSPANLPQSPRPSSFLVPRTTTPLPPTSWDTFSGQVPARRPSAGKG